MFQETVKNILLQKDSNPRYLTMKKDIFCQQAFNKQNYKERRGGAR